jgi:thioredoxin 1
MAEKHLAIDGRTRGAPIVGCSSKPQPRRWMSVERDYAQAAPTRAEIDAARGPVLLEFGTPWCGFCRVAQPFISRSLMRHADVGHLKVEDGSGRPLGRSFGVKLWPTLVFLRDGEEIGRLVRPKDEAAIEAALAKIDLAT